MHSISFSIWTKLGSFFSQLYWRNKRDIANLDNWMCLSSASCSDGEKLKWKEGIFILLLCHVHLVLMAINSHQLWAASFKIGTKKVFAGLQQCKHTLVTLQADLVKAVPMSTELVSRNKASRRWAAAVRASLRPAHTTHAPGKCGISDAETLVKFALTAELIFPRWLGEQSSLTQSPSQPRSAPSLPPSHCAHHVKQSPVDPPARNSPQHRGKERMWNWGITWHYTSPCTYTHPPQTTKTTLPVIWNQSQPASQKSSFPKNLKQLRPLSDCIPSAGLQQISISARRSISFPKASLGSISK